MFGVVGASGMFKESRAGCIQPPTHVKKQPLENGEKKLQFLLLFGFRSERFTAKNHDGWDMGGSRFLKNYRLGMEG